MNDFERKLSQQPFRNPPADLRAAIFGPEPEASVVVTPVVWTWRDWLWPSPQAWAALAALWLLFAAVQIRLHSDSEPARLTALPAPQTNTPLTLLTAHSTRDYRHVLDLTN
jgi:hypothetical protein